MRLQILEHFLNRPVKVTLKNRDTVSGILRVSELDQGAIELEPTSKYDAKRGGATILMADEVVTIRPLNVKLEYLDEDCEEKECYEDSMDYSDGDDNCKTYPADFLDDLKKASI